MWSNAVVLIDITLIPRKCGLNSIQESRKCGRAVVTLTDCPPLWDWEQQRVPHHIAPNCHIAHCTLRATPPCATLRSAHHGATAKLHKTTTVHHRTLCCTNCAHFFVHHIQNKTILYCTKCSWSNAKHNNAYSKPCTAKHKTATLHVTVDPCACHQNFKAIPSCCVLLSNLRHLYQV